VGGVKGEVPLLAGPTLETYNQVFPFLRFKNTHLPITHFKRQGHLALPFYYYLSLDNEEDPRLKRDFAWLKALSWVCPPPAGFSER
jgi:hypothetical protein